MSSPSSTVRRRLPAVPRPAVPRRAVPLRARLTSAHVIDSRGLTAVGAVTVILLLGMLGGGYDVLTGTGLRAGFAVCFVLGCAVAALRVHREDLRAAVVLPPLLYSVLVLLTGAAERADTAGSFLVRQALALLNALVLGAPVLLTATATALLVAGVRVAGPRAWRPALQG